MCIFFWYIFFFVKEEIVFFKIVYKIVYDYFVFKYVKRIINLLKKYFGVEWFWFYVIILVIFEEKFWIILIILLRIVIFIKIENRDLNVIF